MTVVCRLTERLIARIEELESQVLRLQKRVWELEGNGRLFLEVLVTN